MISKTDISITFFHKNYSELNPEQRKKVDETYDSHQALRAKAERIWGEKPDARTEG